MDTKTELDANELRKFGITTGIIVSVLLDYCYPGFLPTQYLYGHGVSLLF